MKTNITFSESAQEYLSKLLKKQNCEGIGVRMFITQPGTPQAETCLAYCKPGEHKQDDVEIVLKGFSAWLDFSSLNYLEDAEVDYTVDGVNKQLTIKAPNAKMPQLSDDSSLEDKVNYYLQTEINPSLAAHGGMVSLIEIEDKTAILRFGGGCQGCGMVDLTLKEGVEKTLKNKIPELEKVKDLTDHTNRENAYYK